MILQQQQKMLVFTTLFCGITQVTSSGSTLAQAQGQATVSFTGNVPAKCAVIDQSNTVNNEIYIVIETNNVGLGSGDLERVTAVSANNSIKIDCNSKEIDLDISLNRIEAPNFIKGGEAINFDGDGNSIDHTVLVQANGTLINRNGTAGYSVNNLGNVDLVANGNINTGSNGNAEITVTSNFIAQNEELAQGKYIAVFSVTATPK